MELFSGRLLGKNRAEEGRTERVERRTERVERTEGQSVWKGQKDRACGKDRRTEHVERRTERVERTKGQSVVSAGRTLSRCAAWGCNGPGCPAERNKGPPFTVKCLVGLMHGMMLVITQCLLHSEPTSSKRRVCVCVWGGGGGACGRACVRECVSVLT